MPLNSDATLDRAKFDPHSVSEKTEKLNQHLVQQTLSQPAWWKVRDESWHLTGSTYSSIVKVGAAKYRQMRKDGQTALPKPVILDSGRKLLIPSRDRGRDIPCRIFTPDVGNARGVFMHIHGGGWVLSTEEA